MRTLLIALITSIVALAFCQTGLAQFGDGSQPATSPTSPTAPIAQAFVVPMPARFNDALNGLELEESQVLLGLTVTQVDNFGLGKRNGLERGDTILRVNGRQVANETDFRAAFSSIPATTATVVMEVNNVKTGQPLTVNYVLSNDAGIYQSNWGRVELMNDKIPGDFVGSITFYNGAIATVSGKLRAGQLSGTTQNRKFGAGSFQINKQNKNKFDGTVTQGGQVFPFTLFKLN